MSITEDAPTRIRRGAPGRRGMRNTPMRNAGTAAGVAAAALSAALLAGCGSAAGDDADRTSADPAAGTATTPEDGAQPQAVGYTSVARGTPVRVREPDGVLLGDPDAAVTVDAYEDFLCPACARFEKLYGADMADAVSNGSIAVQYHMLNFLDSASASGDYSTRASAAALCVARSGDGELYSQFHSALYQPQVQPVEDGTSDLSDGQLADVARQLGASDDTVGCIADGAEVDEAADRALQSTRRLGRASGGRVSTPTLMNGDRTIDIDEPGWLGRLTGR